VPSTALREYSNVGLPREFDIVCLHTNTDLVLAFVCLRDAIGHSTSVLGVTFNVKTKFFFFLLVKLTKIELEKRCAIYQAVT
jgi:hypothetical protein